MNRRATSLGLAVVLGSVLVATSPAPAQLKMKSFTLDSGRHRCTGVDQLLALDPTGATFAPPAKPGAGEMPAGNFVIRHVSLAHWIDGTAQGAYAIAGHSGPNGDHISPWVVGESSAQMAFPADAPVAFTAGEYLDVHTYCKSGTHWISLTVWYTDP